MPLSAEHAGQERQRAGGRRSPEPQTLRQRDHAALRPYRSTAHRRGDGLTPGEVSHMPTLRIPPDLDLYYLVDNFADPWSNPATILMLHGNAESSAAW